MHLIDSSKVLAMLSRTLYYNCFYLAAEETEAQGGEVICPGGQAFVAEPGFEPMQPSLPEAGIQQSSKRGNEN